jgi:thioredoxin-related protein
MMKHNAAILLLLLSLNAISQGVIFEKANSWKEVVEKAKAANKYIFVDCYTTWCKPCKEMEIKVFQKQSVGEFMNSRFINVKLQIDSSTKDNSFVQSWYGDAATLAKLYQVKAFPSFLLFAPDGRILHKKIGSILDTAAFVSKLKSVLNPLNQYYTLQRRYDSTKDVTLIVDLVNSAREAEEQPQAIGDDFIRSQQNPFKKENLQVILKITRNSTDLGYRLLLDNSKRVNDSLGKGTAEEYVRAILWNEEVVPFYKSTSPVNWKKLESKVKKKSNKVIAKEVLAYTKYNYYGTKEMWPQYAESLLNYLKNYSEKIHPYLLNNLLFNVFLHATDRKILEACLPWVRRTMDYDQNDCASRDTYANFLYKLGRTEEAISWEKKAIQAAITAKEKDQEPQLKETLNKMQRGEKTW